MKKILCWSWEWLFGILIGIDQLFNALLKGAPDETISSRCGRNRRKWYWKWLAWILDHIDPNHCANAIRSEKNRNHLPWELRNK
jgi:hypothetical protein